MGRIATIFIEMANIILTTLNAKFIHSAFGLRYLYANLGDLQPEAAILEFDINQRPIDIVEAILARKPQIVGLGVYIWNVIPTTEVVSLLRRVAPDLKLVLGGPEVSYEWESQEIVQLADYVIPGEADLAFGVLCRELLDGVIPENKLVKAALPDMAGLKLPYSFYDQRDVDHRVIYVEASRGCPFTCEFCLSSLDIPVRQIPLEPLLIQFEDLLSRGVTQFKFVDRTFNLNIATGKRLLSFFRERYRDGLFLHFEMIPDRLPEALRELISWFPPGSLQFEIGIQTLNNEVGDRIRRRQDLVRTVENFRFLREKTGVHIHADLIVGLPGETMESFGRGFDQLLSWGPQEIQVGILKGSEALPLHGTTNRGAWSTATGRRMKSCRRGRSHLRPCSDSVGLPGTGIWWRTVETLWNRSPESGTGVHRRSTVSFAGATDCGVGSTGLMASLSRDCPSCSSNS